MPSRRLRLLPAACLLGLALAGAGTPLAWAQGTVPTAEPVSSPSAEPTPLVPLPGPDETQDPEPEPEPTPEPVPTATAEPVRTVVATRRPRRTPRPTPTPVTTVEQVLSTPDLPTVGPTALLTLAPPPEPLDVGLSEPEPTPESAPPAASPVERPQDPVTRTLQLALGSAAVLGLGGLAGLYLTRESR